MEGSHYLCPDAADQKSRAGYFLRVENREINRPVSGSRDAFLVVLESTTYPGIDGRASCVSVLEARSGLEAGRDFHLAYSAGTGRSRQSEQPVGDDPKSGWRIDSDPLRLARACKSTVSSGKVKTSYSSFFPPRGRGDQVVGAIFFRSVKIAFVNELKSVYAAMGIDIWEVVNAARTMPFGFMPFYPGPGLGGHCIPIDPFYLTWKAREYGQNTRFIELAGEINTAMPAYVVNRVAEVLNDRHCSLKGSRVLLLGLAYKPNVDDMRESFTFVLMDLLKPKQGATVAYHDPHIPHRSIRHASMPHWTGTNSIPWNRKTIEEWIRCRHHCHGAQVGELFRVGPLGQMYY